MHPVDFINVSSFTYSHPSYLNIVKRISFKIQLNQNKKIIPEFGCVLDIVGKAP
jgi:hypothetical protein